MLRKHVSSLLPTNSLLYFSFLTAFFSAGETLAQGCCSGGSGSPIAGGASQGVLQDRQMEIASSWQHISSDRFKTGEKDTARQFDLYTSNYLYTKIAYGVTKDFTLSLESGYYLNKTQYGLDKSDTISSSGIADLIIFPRYDVLNRTTEEKRVELTLGLGYKIPLGKHNDSNLVYTNPTTGQQIFTTSPPIVQPTNGSQDIIGYAFFYRGFPQHNFRLFSTALYIRKGWNSLGQKFGDYASIGIFAGKTFFKNLSVTGQLKGEVIAPMQHDRNIDMLALYNIDVKSTGNKKIAFVPQLSYTFKAFTVFALSEFPLYEYVNGVQVSAKTQVTAGISCRFFTVKSVVPKEGESLFECPMKCERSARLSAGKCKVCGMDLVEQKR